MKSFVKYIILLLPSFVSCQKVGIDDVDLSKYLRVDESVFTPLPITDEEYQLAVEAIQRRALQIAKVEWLPLANVPKNRGSTYPAGTTVKGIPYSSVKEMDKYVGHEVSFYTFLTAVQNPRSVLYNENVAETPYHGVNCAAYYGTVCSMAVNYALGLDAQYESWMYPNLPFFEKVEVQKPESIQVGDVLWMPGHVVMVEKVSRESDGCISDISILESVLSSTSIKQYTLSSFTNRWKESSWVLYRYLDFGRVLMQEDIRFLSSISPENYSVSYDTPFCPSRGDHACYREGEEVVLNVFQEYNGLISIRRDGRLIKQIECHSSDLLLTDLLAGIYELSLPDSQSVCSFEVVQTDVKARSVSGGIALDYTSSNGVPEKVVLCSATGARKYIHVFTEAERVSGHLLIPTDYSDVFLKVFFIGEYGRVSNLPVHLR